MERGAWWATVHGVTKSRTRLSDFTFILLPLRRSLSLEAELPGEFQVSSLFSWHQSFFLMSGPVDGQGS